MMSAVKTVFITMPGEAVAVRVVLPRLTMEVLIEAAMARGLTPVEYMLQAAGAMLVGEATGLSIRAQAAKAGLPVTIWLRLVTMELTTTGSIRSQLGAVRTWKRRSNPSIPAPSKRT